MASVNRRSFLTSLGTAAALAPAGAIRAGAAKKRPNVLFILADDLGWADVTVNNPDCPYETPNIDRLAAAGMNFTDGYAACPVCSPTRASIMTGRHPVRVDITDWIKGQCPKNRRLLGPQDRDNLARAEITMAEMFKEEGYRTFFAGKWHLGGEGHFPEDQGFEINKGGHHRGSPPGGYYAPYKNPKLDDGPKGEYLPDRLTDETLAFMKKHVDSAPGKPFLAYLAFYTVHTPIQACKRHLDYFKKKLAAMRFTGPALKQEHGGRSRTHQDNAAYATMVHAMDENVGRLLDALEKLNIADDTVVVFMSDNGGLCTLGRRAGGPTSNLPLRSGKGWCYEGGIREPFIIRAPGVATAGRSCPVPVVSMDFLPTMLELAGLKARPDRHCDGMSLVPLLKGGDSLSRPALYWHYPHYHGSTWTPGAAIRAGDWKLIEFYHYGKAELYNLADDIGERRELSEKHPDKKAELLAMLHAWQKKLGAKMPRPNPRYKSKRGK